MRSVKFAIISVVLAMVPSQQSRASIVGLQDATATFSQAGFDVSEAIDGVYSGFNGWAIYDAGTNTTGAQTAVFQTVTPVGVAGGTDLIFQLYQNFMDPSGHNLGLFQLAVTTDNPSGVNASDLSTNWTVLNPVSATALSATLTIRPDGSVLASGPNDTPELYTIAAMTPLVGITGIRLEVLQDGSLPLGGPGRQYNGNFVLSELTLNATPASASATSPEPSTLGAALCGVLLVGGYTWRFRKRP